MYGVTTRRANPYLSMNIIERHQGEDVDDRAAAVALDHRSEGPAHRQHPEEIDAEIAREGALFGASSTEPKCSTPALLMSSVTSPARSAAAETEPSSMTWSYW